MARWIGMLVIGLTLTVVSVGAQDTKKGKLDAEVMFKKLDANSNGLLEKVEFLKLAEQFKDKSKARDKLTMVYEMIDPENKGLSKSQFRTYIDSKKKKE